MPVEIMRPLIAIFLCLTATVLAAAEQKVTGTDAQAAASREFLAGRFEEALAQIGPSEKDDTAEGIRLSLRGSIYLEQGKMEEAIADFRAAYKKNSALAPPRIHLGDALLRLKKWDEARTVYTELMKDTNILMLNERLRYAVLLTYLGAKDEAGARTALDRLVFPTESPAYYYAQAAWAFAHGSNDAAAKWMKTAAEIFDDQQTAWFARPLYDFGWIKTKPPLVLY